MNKYAQIMDIVEVDENMRSRILSNIEGRPVKNKSSVVFMHRWSGLIAAAACLVLLIGGALAMSSVMNINQESLDYNVTPEITEVSSLEELSQATDLPVTSINNLPFQVTGTTYVSYLGEMAEIIYEGEGNTCTYRMSEECGDNSGDFTDYENVTTVRFTDFTATLKGNQGSYNLVIWSEGGYSYSLYFENGVTLEDITNIIN